MTDAEEETLIEREVLAHALRRSRLQLATLESRSGTFWSRVSSQDAQDDLWMEAQQYVWAEQRGVYEQACLQPLSTCIAELRRWQGVQRAAHERKCAQVKVRSEVEDGNLQWAIFCARLAHDSNGAVGATPLTPEQTRFAGPWRLQLQPQTRKTRDPRTLSAPGGAGEERRQAADARSTRGSCSELCRRASSSTGCSRASLLASSPTPTRQPPPPPAWHCRRRRQRQQQLRLPAAGQQRHRLGGATAGTTKADRLNGLAAAAAGSTASETASLDPRAEAAAAAVLAPAGKRMPLFPRSMRLSSTAPGGCTRTAERVRPVPLLPRGGDGRAALPRVRNAHKTAAGITRSLAHRLSTSAEVSAVSIAGADLEVRLPEQRRARATSGRRHLRPASVDTLAVDALWPKMDPTARSSTAATRRPTPNASAGRLTTLRAAVGGAQGSRRGGARRGAAAAPAAAGGADGADPDYVSASRSRRRRPWSSRSATSTTSARRRSARTTTTRSSSTSIARSRHPAARQRAVLRPADAQRGEQRRRGAARRGRGDAAAIELCQNGALRRPSRRRP